MAFTGASQGFFSRRRLSGGRTYPFKERRFQLLPGNQSSHLASSGAPSGPKGFAVTFRSGRGFWHWLVVNILSNNANTATAVVRFNLNFNSLAKATPSGLVEALEKRRPLGRSLSTARLHPAAEMRVTRGRARG